MSKNCTFLKETILWAGTIGFYGRRDLPEQRNCQACPGQSISKLCQICYGVRLHEKFCHLSHFILFQKANMVVFEQVPLLLKQLLF